ncbi:putative short chain oxidoreductase/dehydrogenase [Viridothelium virens]|uniref:Putative short chain oxidoreductase/dehydrogenase n=1 Tax=Viridothelium virens TaxID=1048519 RepID=A0A6A6HA75_VIRVR|nr:putative short chain oxidoreductase/dehydrogenase [Viridothelium virens]
MSKSTPPQVWLVTGSSAGLGWEIVRAAQEAGRTVIASSRNPSKTAEKVRRVEEKGGSWIPLDVASPDLEKQLDVALEKYGKIDVLVNNAGFAVCGTLEDVSIELQRSVMETNFFGPLRTMRHIIPSMRKQKRGTIVNVTSEEGIRSIPTLAGYTATKHALQAATISVRQEVAQFGIRAFAVAPGAIRTDFNDAARVVGLSEPYKGTTSDDVVKMLLASGGNQTGDPKKMASRILELVDESGIVKTVVEKGDGFEKLDWMPLGTDIGPVAKSIGSDLKSKAEKLEGIWSSVDYDT